MLLGLAAFTPTPVLTDTSGADWQTGLWKAHRELWPFEEVMGAFDSWKDWPPLSQWARTTTRNPSDRAVQFVQHVARRRGASWQLDELYDGRIFLHAEVPSRPNNWHDFFNMCAWHSYPKAKRAINAAQFAALQRWLGATHGDKLPGARLAEQDALALLDEGGLVLVSRVSMREVVLDALLRHDVLQMSRWCAEGNIFALLFGHAVAEHIVSKSGEVRGSCVPLFVDSVDEDPVALRSAADAALAKHIEAHLLIRRGPPGMTINLAQKTASYLGLMAASPERPVQFEELCTRPDGIS